MNTAFLSLLVSVALGQVPAEGPKPEPDRKEQLRFFKEKATELAVFLGPDAKSPQPLTSEPVLRYSNPEREIGSLDGATYLWLDGTRPIAAVSFSIRKLNNAAYRECTSLTSVPLQCRADETAVWSPKTGGLLARPLADTPAPAATKTQRLTQMRTLARRFSATCHNSRTDEPTELRLLPQPIYRFEDERAGILDGALFAFVVSNDPELLLLLEAVSSKGRTEGEWRYSLARMSSLKETIRLDDKEIWTVPNFYRDPGEDRKTGPYVETKIGGFVPGDPAKE